MNGTEFLRSLSPAQLKARLGWLEWAIISVALVSLVLRLWELTGRTMHYDEAIHLHYAWKLAQGMEYIHSPWMHGPLQIELVAGFLKLLGDTDFVARLPYVLFGVALVILPYFLRRQLGDKGALCTAVILTFSPSLLYFSRFGRNDILMVVWAVLLLIFLWRYHETSQRRYLFGTAAVTALMLASKETAYFIIFFMGLSALALSWRHFWNIARRRMSLADLGGAGGFFILMATLTLPQAAASVSILQEPLGLTFAVADTGDSGTTGAPVWGPPFLDLPLWDAATSTNAVALLALLGALLAVCWFVWRVRNSVELATVAVTGLCAVASVVVVVIGPMQSVMSDPAAAGQAGAGQASGIMPGLGTVPVLLDWLIGAALLLVGVGMRWIAPTALGSSRRMAAVLGSSVVVTWLWLIWFGSGLTAVAAMLPAGEGIIRSSSMSVNYLIPVLTLALLLVVSATAGIVWGGWLWLRCAALFYAIWLTLYTTLFTNLPGVFTGAWQSLGYWFAQQEVARGNQPWYYYGVGLTVYELLALVFGLAALVWIIRRREPFGLILAAWVIGTLAVYTIAGEKMPWLLVNITVPLALTGGMFLGHLIDGVRWPLSITTGWRLWALLLLAPVWVAGAVCVVWLAARGDIAAVAGLLLLPAAAAIAWLVRKQAGGGKAVALGIAALLLVFGTVTAFRAAYTYDDSNLEILVYAQGASDLEKSYQDLKGGALNGNADLNGNDQAAVSVDYSLWYPFQWYVRNETENGVLKFDTFCRTDGGDATEGCHRVAQDQATDAYMAESASAVDEAEAGGYLREGPRRNLLWYPETYRRPGESRYDTSMWMQLAADFRFFWDTAIDREKWRQAIEYIVARRQESDWYYGEYYQYTKQ